MINKIKNLRIKKRLFASSVITSAILMLATVLSIGVLAFALNRYNHVLTNYAFPQGDIGHAMTALADIRSATRGGIGYNEEELINRMISLNEENREKLDTYLALIEESIVTEVGKEEFAEIQAAIDAYLEIDAKVLALGATTDETLSRQAQQMADDEMAPAYRTAYSAMEALMNTNVSLGDSTQKTLNITVIIMIIVVVVVIVAALLLATKLSGAITNTITEPLNALIDRMRSFAAGDISSSFPKHEVDDEIADVINAVTDTTAKLQTIFADLEQLLGEMANGNFNITTSCEEEYIGEYEALLLAIRKMNRQMDETLREVKGAANTVSMGAGNLAEASQALAEGATDQAASVEELTATIDEITSALEKTVKEVHTSYEMAEKCASEAEKSRTEMAAMTDAMNRISETSLKIGDIIAELEDIASQTNLLSLNASIEAARAGDAGRGFAVVADQIRHLAEQSATSAVNTRELIEGSIREVEIGNQAAMRTSDVLGGVVEAIHEIATVSSNVSDLAKRQSEAMQQADQGIERISEVVQANSAAAEESSATSEELSAQAISMEELVNKFNLRA